MAPLYFSICLLTNVPAYFIKIDLFENEFQCII